MDLSDLSIDNIRRAADNNNSIEVNIGIRFEDIIDNGGDINNFNDYVQYMILGDGSDYLLEDISYYPTGVTGGQVIHFDVIAYPVAIPQTGDSVSF